MIIEPYPSWVEVHDHWADTGDTHIVHIQPLNSNAHRPPLAFCRFCWVTILRVYCDHVAPPMTATSTGPAEPAVVKASAKRMLKKHGKSFKKLAAARRPAKRKAHAMP